MSGRGTKGKDTVRMHVQMPPEWRALIDRAAKRAGMSRSLYLGRKAYERALQVLGEEPQTPDVQAALDAILEQLALIETLTTKKDRP